MKHFLRGVLFACLPTVFVLGIAELALRAAGAKPATANLSRGFDQAGTYVAPDPELPGGYRTHIYPPQHQHMESHVPAKGEARRVLLLGGSNTESFPEEILEQELERRNPDREAGYEVVNLGRQGYGSARVATLLAQSLVLEPDLVVIYSGHNEFIELDFQLELAALEQDTSSLRRLLRHSVAFTALSNRLEPKQVWNSGEEPKTDPKWLHEESRAFTYQQTLERFERYRGNLELMFRLAREAGAEILICTPVSNELAMPLGWELPESFPPAQVAGYKQQRQEWMKRLPEPMSAFIPRTGRDRIKSFAWVVEEVVEPDLANVPRLRELAEPFNTDPPYLQSPGRWIPQLARRLAVQEQYFHAPLDEAERGGLERFLADGKRFTDRVPDDPMVHFGRGIALLRLGRGAEAAEALHLAAARDRGPQSANDTSNDIVRALAAANDDVHLFDSQALYRERTPNGIVGYELMRDECHLHTRAYRQLMLDLAPHILLHENP